MSEPRVLVLACQDGADEADGASGARQAARILGPAGQLAGAYEGLEALAGRNWQAVLLGARPDELPGLARACRRLGPAARIVALCPPAAEPAVRAMVGPLVDDYVIDPPTPADLHRLVGPAKRPAQTPAASGLATDAAGAAREPALPADDLARLIAATANRPQLEQALLDLLGARLGVKVEWVDAGPACARPPLLRLEASPARVLVGPAGPLSADQQRHVWAVAPLAGALDQAALRTASLHRLAVTDHLTGAYNRRYFYQVADQILQRAGRRGLRATVLLYDIDDFKSYNGRFGHAGGDEILRETAALMKQITRSHDVVARIGGDEFAVLFWDADPPRVPGSRPPESAYNILANRFLKAVSKHEFPSLGPDAVGLLTISGGLANFPADGRTVRELLRSADLALDAVKRTGKNAIRLIGPH